MYALLRALAGVALRWYYRDIQVEGLERVPRDRPLLLVVNHPNALVDALLVGWVVPRRVLITAKATLFANPIAGALLRWLGVVPLRRASDEAKRQGSPLDPSRNIETFRAVHDALARGGVVLIFPEGRVPDEPALAPLKTGAARMALHATQAGDVPGLALVPIGLVFERKEAPRSRVLVQVGEPIDVAEWRSASGDGATAEALTDEIAARLRSLTFSYATVDDAARAARLSSAIASLFGKTPEIGVVDRRLGVDASIARRIEALSAHLASADESTRARADALLRRLADLQQLARDNGVYLSDVRIDMDSRPAAWFVVREGWYVLLGGPIALWGRVNHWLPLTAARLIAMRRVESAADPAMRTIVAGAALVVLTYLAQTAAVWLLFGPIVALAYLLSLPIAADINFSLSDRMRRARRRAHAFLLFRRKPELKAQLEREIVELRREVIDLYRALEGVSAE